MLLPRSPLAPVCILPGNMAFKGLIRPEIGTFVSSGDCKMFNVTTKKPVLMVANGNKWQDTARKQLCATASSPFICQALARPLSQIFLFSRALSLCPPIGHSVTGRPTKRRRGACGRGDGLTLHRPLCGFVYRTLSLLPLVKRRQVKNTTDGERRETEGGADSVFYLSSCPGGV